MKRTWFFAFLPAYLCLCLLASCAAGGTGGSGGTSTEEQGEGTVLCRVVSEEDGTLVLAETGSTAVFTLPLADAQRMTLDGKEFDPSAPGAYGALPAGSLAGTMAEVTYQGGLQETWPVQFSSVTALAFSTEEFDDLCVLYRQVLEDLWSVDEELNSDLTAVGVDLSGTSLSYTERLAVAWDFASDHGVTVVEGTWDELLEQGYITGEPLDGTEDGQFYQWEDGCLFTIDESDDLVAFNMPAIAQDETAPAYDAVAFDAQKWRSSLGAYAFSGCTAASDGAGHWDSYTVGTEMIS